MRCEFGGIALELVVGDITEQDVDAIVNAANSTLLGGGGVDGAIHRTGGPQILEECRLLGGCATGDAKITSGGRLKARYVIHAVGPAYWHEGGERSAELLASAYRRSLEVAEDHRVATLAFPSISTGAYGYPLRQAAAVALGAVCQHLAERKGAEGHPEATLRLVRFVLYDQGAYLAYERALVRLCPP